jgi:hypothetical protein
MPWPATLTPRCSPACSTATRSPPTTGPAACRSRTARPPAGRSCRKRWSAAYWRPSMRPRRCSARHRAPSASSTACRITTGMPESPRSATSARWPSLTSAGRHTESPRSGNCTRPPALFPRVAAWWSWTPATGRLSFPGWTASNRVTTYFYRQATDRLIQAGFDVLQVEVNQRTPEQAAMFIRNRLMSFFTVSKD